jgi:hypothetical protein
MLNLDDGAAYPPFRRWTAWANQGAVAAQFAYCGVCNVDAPGTKSVVVVDEVIWRYSVADDGFLRVSLASVVVLGGLIAAYDIAQDKEQQPSDQPRLGNVNSGTLSSVSSLGGVYVPSGNNLPQRVSGLWTLGPGESLSVQPGSANNQCIAFFRGRYYSAP